MGRSKEPSAVVLLSGGLDSATAAACAKRDGFALLALTVVYGQRHIREVESARALARALGAREHLVVQAPLDQFAGSALTDRAIKVLAEKKVKILEGKEVYAL